MHRAAVRPGETAAYLRGFHGLRRCQRPHRHHQWPAKSTCRVTRDVRAIHRHVHILFDVPNRNIRGQSAFSNVNEQPMTNETRSPRYNLVMSGSSSTSSPFFQTR